jgi:hypothetical protein
MSSPPRASRGTGEVDQAAREAVELLRRRRAFGGEEPQSLRRPPRLRGVLVIDSDAVGASDEVATRVRIARRPPKHVLRLPKRRLNRGVEFGAMPRDAADGSAVWIGVVEPSRGEITSILLKCPGSRPRWAIIQIPEIQRSSVRSTAGRFAVARSSDGRAVLSRARRTLQIQNAMPPAAMQPAEPVTQSNDALGEIGLGTCTDRAAQDAGPLGEYEAEGTAR